MKTKWSLARIKDILLAVATTATLIVVVYGYIGSRYMESSRITELVVHAQDRDLHFDALKNQQLKDTLTTVTREVIDLRFNAVAEKLETLKKGIDKVQTQHEEIKGMFVRLIKDGGPGRR